MPTALCLVSRQTNREPTDTHLWRPKWRWGVQHDQFYEAHALAAYDRHRKDRHVRDYYRSNQFVGWRALTARRFTSFSGNLNGSQLRE